MAGLRIILRAMFERGPLSEPPSVEIEVVSAQARPSDAFVWVRKLELVNRYPDGAASARYPYFMVERLLLDAVCVVLFRRDGAEPELLLRTQLRPPLAFRHEHDVPEPARGTGAVQWEVPAGLIERGERGQAGIITRAQAETLEEVGLRLPVERFTRLAEPTSLSPGLIAEKLHYVVAEVFASDVREAVLGDGHPVEERSISRFVPLSEAQRGLEDGLIHDLKTEVALSRLRTYLSAR